ncbi:MAG TPA: flagellar basal body-associated FliL family protein [Acidocella sp.]|nr:flagellar basal body-associated FliL family protein [Acidocella sp.]
MKKLLIICISLVIVLLLAGGGAFAYLTLGHNYGTAQAAKPAKPAPIYFAELNDLVISIPDQAGDPPADFVDISLQFQTALPDQVQNFSTIEPIIRSQLIGLLMNQTAKTLADPAVRTQIQDQSLALVNNALLSRNYAQKPPFSASFITNLVVQD